jgi:hypothetical protein
MGDKAFPWDGLIANPGLLKMPGLIIQLLIEFFACIGLIAERTAHGATRTR